MKKNDRDIIREDVDFIAEYMADFLRDRPDQATNEVTEMIRKIDRRLGDILKRVEG